MSQFGYLIVTFQPSLMGEADFVKPDFLVDEDVFSKSFKNKWAQGKLNKEREPLYKWVLQNGEQKIIETSDTVEFISWSLPPEDDGNFLSGYIEEYAISLGDFPRKSFADFILWYREFTSNEIPLYLVAPDYLDEALELKRETTKEEVFRFIGFSTMEIKQMIFGWLFCYFDKVWYKMEIYKLAIKILSLENDSSVSENTWSEAKQEYISALDHCNNADELKSVLKLNSELRFPIDLTMNTYEKLTSIIATDNLLKEYAAYLYLHGPDWDAYANQLVERAEKMSDS